jgi:hypothetical protein
VTIFFRRAVVPAGRVGARIAAEPMRSLDDNLASLDTTTARLNTPLHPFFFLSVFPPADG